MGGVSDHVHLLIGLRATHCLADVLRELKSVSSGWIRDEIGVRNFAWQEGYGGFTVSASQCETVRRYVEQQEEHHRTRTFREEVLGIVAASQNRIRLYAISDSGGPLGLDNVIDFHPVVCTTG